MLNLRIRIRNTARTAVLLMCSLQTQELDGEKTKFCGRLGCSLIDFLLVSSALASFPESKAGKALDDLLKDIFARIREVGTKHHSNFLSQEIIL
jgi:hypothetical protein